MAAPFQPARIELGCIVALYVKVIESPESALPAVFPGALVVAMLWAFGGVFWMVMPVMGVFEAWVALPARSPATARRS